MLVILKGKKMGFLLNARGRTATNVIMWFAGIIAVLIIGVWFMQNNPYGYLVTIDRLDEDILQLSQRINGACNAFEYYAEYNPLSEKGYVDFTGQELCIRTSEEIANPQKSDVRVRRCVSIPCSVNSTTTLDLSDLTYIVIEKNENVVIRKIQ
jgi:hypothetical protein